MAFILCSHSCLKVQCHGYRTMLHSMLLHTCMTVYITLYNSMTNLLSEFKSCNQHQPVYTKWFNYNRQSKQRTHTLAFLSLSAGVSVHTERSPQSVRPVRNFLAPKPTDTQAQIQSATLIRNRNGEFIVLPRNNSGRGAGCGL